MVSDVRILQVLLVLDLGIFLFFYLCTLLNLDQLLVIYRQLNQIDNSHSIAKSETQFVFSCAHLYQVMSPSSQVVTGSE